MPRRFVKSQLVKWQFVKVFWSNATIGQTTIRQKRQLVKNAVLCVGEGKHWWVYCQKFIIKRKTKCVQKILKRERNFSVEKPSAIWWQIFGIQHSCHLRFLVLSRINFRTKFFDQLWLLTNCRIWQIVAFDESWWHPL